ASIHAGGFWSPEFVYPHHAFAEAGYDITVATLGGVPAPVDAASLSLGLQENDQSSVDFQREYLDRAEIRSALANPTRLENLVTGQNGASARQTAAAVIAKLSDPSR